MFTKQIPDLIRQLQGQIPDQAVTAFNQILGNCSQRLEHRGPVTVEIDGNYMPGLGNAPRGGPLSTECGGEPVAALTAVNRSGKFTGEVCESDCVTGGLALRAIGPCQLDSARIDQLYVSTLADLCGTPVDPGGGGPGGVVMVRVKIEVTPTGIPNARFCRLQFFNGTFYVTGDRYVIIDFTANLEWANRWRTNSRAWGTKVDDRTTINIGGTDYPVIECVWAETNSRWLEFILLQDMVAQRADAAVLYEWGATARLPQFAVEEIYDRMNKIPNAKAGFRGIAVYDEIADEYISIADDDQGVPLPPDGQIYNVKVTTGDRLANCIYDGVRVDLNDVTNFCNVSDQELEPIWIFAPNMTEILPANSYHWGLDLQANYDFNGDVRPAYSIKFNPYYFRCARIPAGTVWNPITCLFGADLIEIDLSALDDGGGGGGGPGMDFPEIMGKTEGNASASTTHVVTLPTDIQAGETLVVLFAYDINGTVASVTTPATGWSETFAISMPFHFTEVFWRTADGMESPTITVTLTNAQPAAWLAYRIRGVHPSQPFHVHTATTYANTTTIDVPTTTVPWGAETNLFIAVGAWEGAPTLSSYPASHTDHRHTSAGGVSGSMGIFGASISAQSATNDPSPFTISAATWVAGTVIAFRPDDTLNEPPPPDACNITYNVVEPILVYIPIDPDQQCTSFPHDKFLWVSQSTYDVGGIPVYMYCGQFHDCGQIVHAGVLTSDTACDGALIVGDVDDYPGVDIHWKANPPSPLGVLDDNMFNLCGLTSSNFGAIDRSIEFQSSIPIQMQRTCTSVATGLGGAGGCSLNFLTIDAGLMKCAETSEQLNLTTVFCGCECDNQSCGCPQITDTVTGQICFTGVKNCDDTMTVVQECQNLVFAWNAGLGQWEAEISCPMQEPALLRAVYYHVPGNQQGEGWAKIRCNWDKNDVLKVVDDNCGLIAGALVDAYHEDNLVDDQFVVCPDECLDCTRHYRIVFNCAPVLDPITGEPQLNPFGIPILNINAWIEHIAPPDFDGEEPVAPGQVIGDTEDIILSTQDCRSFSGTFDETFGRSLFTHDFDLHTYCGFLQGTGESGMLQVFW